MAFRFRIPAWLGDRTRSEVAKAETVAESVDNIDANASGAAAATQSRKDAAAERQENPAEQGGEG
jgi:hypothetical protein